MSGVDRQVQQCQRHYLPLVIPSCCIMMNIVVKTHFPIRLQLYYCIINNQLAVHHPPSNEPCEVLAIRCSALLMLENDGHCIVKLGQPLPLHCGFDWTDGCLGFQIEWMNETSCWYRLTIDGQQHQLNVCVDSPTLLRIQHGATLTNASGGETKVLGLYAT